MMVFAASLVIILHAPDQHEVRINPRQITSLHSPRANAKKDEKLYDESVGCLVNLADGKFVSVVETCVQVEFLIDEALK